MKSKRQIRREQQRKKQLYARYVWIGLGVILVAGLAYVIFNSAQPAAGEEVPVMASSSHVPEGTDPGPYNTNPPTSGHHYASEMNAGFYDTQDPQKPYPAGYLVHNLEHGYVIFWYNCDLLSEQECNTLKDQIKSVMDQEDNFKVIAYPWKSIDVPVVMTSWGHLLKFKAFDPQQAKDFVDRNRGKAPEPNAP